MNAPADRIADRLTEFSGSWLFLILHAIWWTVWFGFALEINSLTLAVSLEAIVLSTVILMSQNRAAARDHAAFERDRIRHKHIEQIAERIELLEQRQFAILRHLEQFTERYPLKKSTP